MSVQRVYSVRDSAAGFFGRPFLAVHEGVAKRDFSMAVNTPSDPPSPMFTNPADFELYDIGSFDDHSGKIEPSEPVLVSRGLDVKAPQ